MRICRPHKRTGFAKGARKHPLEVHQSLVAIGLHGTEQQATEQKSIQYTGRLLRVHRTECAGTWLTEREGGGGLLGVVSEYEFQIDIHSYTH